MAFANLKGLAYFPRMPLNIAAAPSFVTVGSLDASGEGVACMCEAPKTGNIRKILWRTRSVTGAGTLTARIKQVDRTGTPAIPHATNLWGANTTGDQALITTSDDSIFVTQLTADAAVVQGDPLAVELIITDIGTLTLVEIAGFGDDRTQAYPYGVVNTSGAYVITTDGTTPILGFEYDDGSYEPIVGCSALLNVTTTTFGSGSTPDTIGQRFQFAVPVRVAGFWLWTDADDDFSVKLVTSAYNQGAGTGIVTGIASQPMTKNVNNEDRRMNASNIHELLWPDCADLSASTNYRLVIEPGATGISIYDQSFESLAAMDAEDMGQNFHMTTAKDPTADGDWTNYNSGTFRSLYCGLLLKGFSDGAGGGGGTVGIIGG